MTSPFLSIDNSTFSLEILINVIINTYFIKAYCLVIITENKYETIKVENSLPIMYYFKTQMTTKTFSSMILKSLDSGCSDFIINVENPESFVKLFDENIHVTNQRRGNRKIIFVPNRIDITTRNELTDLLRLPVVEFIPDILLILPTCDSIEDGKKCRSYELGTQKYIGESDNNELLILDEWNIESNVFEMNKILFPDKMTNMEGRPLKAATFSYKPYSILELDADDNVIGLDGTEMRVALEFCNWSNCSIKIVRDDEHEWGEIWDNRSGNGILGNIAMDKADIGYGALYTWYHEYGFLDLSMPAVRTGITCIAPAPLLVPSWLLPVLPFNSIMWISVFLASVFGAIAMYITSKPARKQLTVIESTLAIVGIMALQVPSIPKPPSALRHVLSWLLLFSLMLTNAYSSGLASSITVPKYEAPIDTVQQLVDSNLEWGATHDAWIFSILFATEPNMVHLVEKFRKYSDKKLRSRGTSRDFAYSVERLPAGNFAIGDYVTEEAVAFLQLMQQDIYWEQCVLMARKSSPFSKRLNLLLSRLHQAGLLHAWESQVVLKHLNYGVQLGVRLSQGRHGSDAEPRQLGVNHLQGALFLSALGLVAAGVAFLAELAASCSHHRPKQNWALVKQTVISDGEQLTAWDNSTRPWRGIVNKDAS